MDGKSKRMKLMVIADDETLPASLPAESADVLISCGDLADSVILECASRCGCRHILAVKGNHDSSGKFPANIVDLHFSTEKIDNVAFGGFAGAWRYKPKGNFLFDQAEVKNMLRPFPKVDVFIAHNSPRGIHDREDDVHLGFEDFVQYIDTAQPSLFLHGHQHLSTTTQRGATTVAGIFGSQLIEIG